MLVLLAAMGCGPAPTEPPAPPPPAPSAPAPKTTPPPPPVVRVTPEPAFPFDELHCGWSAEARSGATVTWRTAEGSALGEGATLPPPGLPVGATVECVVTLPDATVLTGTVVLAAPPAPGNLLLVIADDLGADSLERYGIGATFPETPVLDALADQGVLFRRAYADPLCSPTRATLQTGRHGFRTGVTAVLPEDAPWSLSVEETTLPELLLRSPEPYASAFLGKWHLAGDDGPDHPNRSGYGFYRGTLVGLNQHDDGSWETYSDWDEVWNGVRRRRTGYLTTATVDDALEQIATLPEPWLVVVSFNAPHEPLHFPPTDLWTELQRDNPLPVEKFHAMIEAMDTELGRLLDGLGEREDRTTVAFVGDNGAWSYTVADPLDPAQSKGTPYEGGIHVPLIVRGPLVGAPGRVSDALVNTVDLFPTFADLGGVELTPEDLARLDGRSLLHQLRDPSGTHDRAYVFSARADPAGFGPYYRVRRAIRDAEWKLLENLDGSEAFYDMRGVEVEGEDLLAAGELTSEASAALERLRGAWPDRQPAD